jgi:hypothetical protein
MAKESSLSPLHRANGAMFREENGWLLPAHFGDRMSEYRAVRDAVGLSIFPTAVCCNSPDRTVYRFSKACCPTICAD